MLAAVVSASAQAFIDKGVHAKVTSLGRAAVAMTSDASLIFYNPAAIGFETKANAFTGYTNLYPDIIDENMNVVTAGGAYALDGIGVVGVGLTQFTPSLWSERTIIGTFATRMFGEELSVGANAKLLMWSADAPKGENAVPEPALSYTGLTFDIGATYRIAEIAEENDLSLGVAVLNLTQPSVASDGSSDASLPMEATFGGAYTSRKYHYTILGAVAVTGQGMKMQFGTEILAMQTAVMGIESSFAVRVGGGRLLAESAHGEYSGGFGLKVEDFTLDYSFSYQAFIQHVGGISSLSLGYTF